MDIDIAKQIIKDKIIPVLNSQHPRSNISPKLKKEILKILDEHRPDLAEFFKNYSRKYSIQTNVKYHMLYCFLHNEKIYWYTKYFKIDKNRNRIIKKTGSIIEWAKLQSQKSKYYTKSICDYGLDKKFPKILTYENSRIAKIVSRLKTKHLKCPVCGRYVKRTFIKQKTCGVKCQSKLSSTRMSGKENPSIKFYEKIFTNEYRKASSERMKEKIANGEFTPCVTNSWSNSKIYIKDLNCNFRSSWEAYFFIHMTFNGCKLSFEEVRIPYFDSKRNKRRTYITDFVDYENKIIYEIKPDSMKETQTIVDKESAAMEWCEENGFIFKYISNHWFEENYDKKLIYSFDILDYNREKIIRCLKQFEGIKIENNKY